MQRLWVAFAAGAALLWLCGGAAAAEPQALGSLAVSPAEGDLDTPLDLVTEGECSRGTAFVVTVDGKGLSEDRGNLVGATTLAGLGSPRYPGHYVVPVNVTLREYLMRSLTKARLSGDYRIAFVCRNTLDTEPLQEFAGTIRVDGNGNYRALGDAARDVRVVVGAEAYDRAEEADRISREAEMAATESAEPDVPGAPGQGGPAATSADSASGPWWRTGLIALGVLLLVIAALSWLRGRRRTPAPAERTTRQDAAHEPRGEKASAEFSDERADSAP